VQVQQLKRSGKTLYETVESRIYDDIVRSNFQPGQRLSSPDVIATQFNVSEGTVRHALQRLAAKKIIVRKPRSGTFVNTDFRELNKTSELTSENQGRCTDNIVLLVPRVECPDWANLAGGLYDAVSKNGLDLSIANTENDPNQYEKLIDRHLKANVFGLAFATGSIPQLKLETLLMLQKSGMPIVCLFGTLGGFGWPTILSDIGSQAYIATKHLCEIGRKKIAYVGSSRPLGVLASESTVTQNGYMRALLEFGRAYNPELQFFIDDWSEYSVCAKKEEELSQRLESWLASRDLDAVFCTSDHTAYPAIAALRRLDKKVPGDVAVVGCGNLGKYHQSISCELSTVDICIGEIAAKACELLIAMRKGEKIPENLVIPIQGRLLIGQSTVRS